MKLGAANVEQTIGCIQQSPQWHWRRGKTWWGLNYRLPKRRHRPPIHTLQLPGVSKFRPYSGSTLLWELLLYFKRVAGGQQLNCNGVKGDAELEVKLHRRDSNGMVCKDQRCIHTD